MEAETCGPLTLLQQGQTIVEKRKGFTLVELLVVIAVVDENL